MRATGFVEASRGLQPGDHVCWVYDDDARYADDVVSFLAEGLDRCEQVSFVNSGTMDDAYRTLRGLGDVEALIDQGALTVSGAHARYADQKLTARAQVSAYAAATARALDAGYTGFRVAADVTSLVLETSRRTSFADYEHLVDRFIARHPFTALCSYDGRQLGGAVREIACLHPLTNLSELAFQVFAAGPAGEMALAGEVDAFCAEEFARALAHATGDRPTVLRVDGSKLRFIDHRGLTALAGCAPRVELRTRFSGAASLCALVGLANVEVTIEA